MEVITMADNTQNNSATPQNPAERPVPLETLNKMIESLSKIPGSDWEHIAQTPSSKDQTTDDRKFLKERAEELGIKPNQLRTIAHYLSLDPTSTDPAVVEARKKEFKKVLTVLQNHVPEPQEGQKMDQKVLDAWQASTTQAKEALETLETEWETMQATKVEFSAQYQSTLQELATTRQRAEETQRLIEQHKKERDALIHQQAESGKTFSAQQSKRLSELESAIKALSISCSGAKRQCDEIEKRANKEAERLAKHEEALVKKKFELTTATLIAALPDKEEKITGARLAILDATVQETRETTEQVRNQTRDYHVAIKDFKDFKKDLEKQREEMGIIKGFLHDIKTKLSDIVFGTSDLTRYQDANAERMQKAIAELSKKICDKACEMETRGAATSSAVISRETKQAMSALKQFNKLEDKIRKEQDKLQSQGMSTRDMRKKEKALEALVVEMKQNLRNSDPGRKYTDEEIKQMPQYQEAASKLTSSKLEKLQAQREQALDEFKSHYSNAREGVRQREARYQEFQAVIESMQRQVGSMYEMGELGQKHTFDFGFTHDLEALLADTRGFDKMQGMDGFQLDEVREFIEQSDPEMAQQAYSQFDDTPGNQTEIDEQDNATFDDPEEERSR